MEENEIEEGEAFDDSCIDPDIALSYIDEKLQDVLGHFQKDFEGGVSAENLGAKFGGYGSFLPSYQRSPSVLTQPKSPLRPPNHAISKSPYNSSTECLRQNSSAPRSISVSKNDTASAAQLSNSGRKENFIVNSLNAGSSIPQPDSNNKPVNGSDQKSLKVRIKVGPDNPLAKSNAAAIYSGLGLDTSPSSSPNDSPDASPGLSLELRDSPGDSPSNILQVMTCFSVPGGYLLSPLHDNLFQLAENKNLVFRKTGILNKGVPEIDMTLTERENRGYVDKKVKLEEKNGRSSKEDSLNSRSVTTKLLKREVDIDTPASKKVTPNVLNNPLQSCSRTGDPKVEQKIISDLTKCADNPLGISKELNRTAGKEQISLPLDPVKDDHCLSMGNGRSGGISNLGTRQAKSKFITKASILETELDEKNPGNHRDTSSDVQREGKSKGRKNRDTSKLKCAEHNVQNDLAEHIKQPVQNVNSLEIDSEKILQENDLEYQHKRKKKGSHNVSAPSVESTQKNLRVPTSVMAKEKRKSSHAKGSHSEKSSKMLKSRKESNRPHSRESNRYSTGNVNVERMENRAELAEPYTFAEKSLDRPRAKKDANLHSEPMVNPAIPASSACAAPTTDATVALDVPAPVLIKDNWVCCDLCQTWRLLPYETDPDHLPKKWTCSMQVWLPGLNNCNISEAETNKAFHALYVAPVPEIGANFNGHQDVAASSITCADAQFLDQRLDHCMQSMSATAKKKSGQIDASNIPKKLVSKKNLQMSVKSRSLNDVNDPLDTNSSVIAGPGLLSKSQDLTSQKQNHKQEKCEFSGRNSDGGDFVGKHGKLLNSKSKREASQDGYRASKKIKKENSDYLDEDRPMDLEIASKAAPNMDNGFATKVIGKVTQNHSDHSSSKDSKSDVRGKLSASTKKLIHPVFSKGVSDMDKSATPDYAVKKRKVKEWQESRGHQDTVISSQNVVQNRLTVKEAFSESELGKQKKAKVSKSEGKEFIMSNADGKTDKKGRHTKILLSGTREQRPDGMNEEGKVAATSSSSKVSSSRKSKANFQEMRGSPVESVSSSPLRTCITGKISIKRNSMVNDNVLNVGPSFTGSPKRCSDGELGSDQSGTRRKEICPSVQLKTLETYRAGESQMSGDTIKDGSFPKRDTHADLSHAEFEETNVIGDIANIFDHDEKRFFEGAEKEVIDDERVKLSNRHLPNGISQWKSSKNSSLKERSRISNSDADRVKLKVNDNSTYQEDVREEKWNLEGRDEKYLGNKNSSAKWSSSDRKNNYSDNGVEERDLSSRVAYSGASCRSNLQGKLQQTPSHPIENPVSFVSNQIDRSETTSARGIAHSLQLSQDKSEALGSQRFPTPVKGNRSEVSPIDAVNGDAPKVVKQLRKPDSQNAVNLNSLRQVPHNGPNVSPMKKDGPSTANVVLKEARDLKHTANRLKGEGLDHESIGLYFQAALKFLHGASLLEPPITESAKHGEMNPSAHMMKMYTDTARLCEYCAHEYEKCKEMAAAALAYKCVEVAYMKVAYYRHSGASKDRHELLASLQTVLPGESPSSSASDVDNLNNQGTLDKAALAKAVGSPQVAGNHVIAARNRPNFLRLLSYTNDLNCAFDATKRCQNAIASASVNFEKEVADGLSSVRKVLDFNFHNVEGLLRLVRLSMESISR